MRPAGGLAALGLAVLAAIASPAGSAPPSPAAATLGAATPATTDPSQAPPAAGPILVRFVEPAPPALLQGPTRILIAASTTDGVPIATVTLYADDALLTRFEKEPYAVRWDAGTRFGLHRLRAVAVDTQGRSAEAILETRRIPLGQVEEVRLVNVYASVRDARGRPALDLTRDDFKVMEDGVPQTVTHFSNARAPITIALLVDASSSMRLDDRIERAREGADEFVQAVEPDDRLLVRWFDDTVHGDPQPVSDRRAARGSLRAITPGGGTALYDALYSTATGLLAADGRRAIVLLSDGRDQALEENEPGSLHLFEEALERAHHSEAAIYAIGLGRHLDREMDLTGTRSVREILETFARQTGGRAWFPERAADVAEIYRQVAADLRQQYTLAYVSTNPARDGRWRRIDVTTGRPDLSIRARSGYYAPGPAAP
ncbi:MAG TPA: VWA domain-containing protein [Dongiaceae bacterium]|nr:VWA domain-containing protein [Dongiaceae bacterium]